MRGLRSGGVVVRSAGLLVVALAFGAPLLGSCGGASRNGGNSSSAGAGAAGSVAGDAGAVAAGAHSVGGSSSDGGGHTAGTQAGGTLATPAGGAPSAGAHAGGRNAAGDAGLAGAGEIGGEGPAGGAAGQEDGWPCGDQRCSVGQSCIHCTIEQTSRRCVPNPDQDPTGYANAIAACEFPPFGREDCDGPEDCPASQYCVANQGTRCQSQPSSQHFCCFACDAITDCTLCHTDQDCLGGESCEPNEVSDTKGCHVVH